MSRLLSARAMVLSGVQRQQNAVVAQPTDSVPQVCGLLGLHSPSDGAYADVLFHDPRAPSMFGSSPKKVTTFKVRAGVLVMFPCWLRYDLTVSVICRKAHSSTPSQMPTLSCAVLWWRFAFLSVHKHNYSTFFEL